RRPGRCGTWPGDPGAHGQRPARPGGSAGQHHGGRVRVRRGRWQDQAHLGSAQPREAPALDDGLTPMRHLYPDGGTTMAEPAPHIDFANLPTPTEGILVTLFITVRKVARSRDFYSRVLGGTVVLDENPCIVKLSNSWIIMNPGGPPTPAKPGSSVSDDRPDKTTAHI